MALEEYQAKRDFKETPEPPARPGKPHRRPTFVIQEHHASRLHYDFRLEADGVLKSWAIPKQPSLDPTQKRLAVRVEDHPLAYAGFEGTIPEGHYGAGHVAIWDHGTYDNLRAKRQTVSEGIEAGRLEFELHGKRLKGRFTLLRMKDRKGGKDNWLLIKSRDEHARSDPSPKDAPRPPRRRPRASSGTSSPPEEVEVTNADKVLFPEAGISKGEVFDYYRRIGDHLVVYLRDRPVTLERYPEGVGEGQPHFWQKNTPTSYPSWIPRIELPTEQGKTVHYTLINDLPTLLYLVNQNALTFHVWLSRVGSLDRPDFVLFDLDPGQASFADVVAVARRLHTLLDADGKAAFVKTSGKSGLHILAPWRKRGGYDEARAWAYEVAEQVVEALPKQATLETRKADRGKRVFVDVTENARGRHVVPPYVLRATPAASVSLPLSWREVTPRLDPLAYTVRTLFRRLGRQKEDPLEPLRRAISQM